MNRRLILTGFVAVGLSLELMAAPAKLGLTTARPVVATGKQVTPVAKSIATPTNSVASATRAAVSPTKPTVTPAKPVVTPVKTAVATAKPKPVVEEETAGGVGVTVKAGTLGGGLEATVGVNDYLGFRFGVNMMNAGPSIERDEGSIKADLDWLSYGALVDLHVFGGGFRVTGGGLINKNKFKLKADLTKSVTLDDQEYNLNDLSGQVTFNELAPYLGIGYGNAVGADGHWHFACDFGVMFQGEPKVDASATASEPALQPYVDNALAKEVADIQDDASAFQFYPVISVGVSYRF